MYRFKNIIKQLLVVVLCLVFSFCAPNLVVSNSWLLDVHYDSSLPNGLNEARRISVHMSGKTYLGSPYFVYILDDWNKSQIIGLSLPYAKVWHMASHGGTDFWGRNFLLTRFNERIYGGEIPSLRNVQGGGPMLLAFASSCRSGRSSSLWYMLHHGFIDQGVGAYMGYLNDVRDVDAFQFADRFYHWVSQGLTVFQSMNRAQAEVPQVQGNIVLYGNQGLHLVN